MSTALSSFTAAHLSCPLPLHSDQLHPGSRLNLPCYHLDDFLRLSSLAERREGAAPSTRAFSCVSAVSQIGSKRLNQSRYSREKTLALRRYWLSRPIWSAVTRPASRNTRR